MVRQFGGERRALDRLRSGFGTKAGKGEVSEPAGRPLEQRAAIKSGRLAIPEKVVRVHKCLFKPQSTYRNCELHINAWQRVSRPRKLPDSGFSNPLSTR